MVNYQTSIQHPKYIRMGSALIEVYNSAQSAWVNLGAIKSLTSTIVTSGEQEFAPDNTPPRIIDPIPKKWEFAFELQEGWNPAALKLLRGDIDTHTTTSGTTTIGVYAGTGSRPRNKVRITNKTPGANNAVITLNKVVTSSELDWKFPSDTDWTNASALPVKLSAEIDGNNGFGTVEIPIDGGSVVITPQSVSIAVGANKQMNVTGATAVTYGMANQSVATVTNAGKVVGVAAGNTTLIITTDGEMHYIPVTVTGA